MFTNGAGRSGCHIDRTAGARPCVGVPADDWAEKRAQRGWEQRYRSVVMASEIGGLIPESCRYSDEHSNG